MKKYKYFIITIIICGCYSLNSAEDIDKYIKYINNRTDTTERVKEFETPNADGKSFGIIKISELIGKRSEIVRISVDINLKELKARYKFYYEHDMLVYCEMFESVPNSDTEEGMIKMDDIYYFKDEDPIKSSSRTKNKPDGQRALILSKFYYIDNF